MIEILLEVVLLCWHASIEGLVHMHIVELLSSKGANPNDEENYAWSPIVLASIGGQVNAIELLLSKRADPNDKTIGFFSPIMWLILVTNVNSDNPLILASRERRINIADLLSSKWANPDDQDNYGWRPIMF